MEVRTLEQIEKEIEETKFELQNVHGTETEVYARIVGYYRAVKHWNNGKKDEFNLRKMFTLEDSKLTERSSETESFTEETTKTSDKIHQYSDNEVATYQLYTRKNCPNCPPVKNFMDKVELPGQTIDVDKKEGLEEAAKNGIFATPTVVFFNHEGVETARCHNVEELEVVFQNIMILA